MTRRLRAVPERAAPIVIDPPESGRACKRREQYAEHQERRGQSSEWQDGWRACRKASEHEVTAAYTRGLLARPVSPAVKTSVAVVVTLAFIAGLVLGAWLA